MNTIFLVLCGTIIVSAMLFLVLLLRVPLADKDFWLKTLSAVLASLVFAIGIPALIAGHFAGKALEREIGDTKGKLEAERLARLDLEEFIAPRNLAVSSEVRARLSAQAGTPFLIETISDGEAKKLAGQIASILEWAEWDKLDTRTVDSGPDGVRIETITGDGDVLKRGIESAARELASYLEANGIDTRVGVYPKRGLATDPLETMLSGTVRIRIGLKPSPYFERTLEAELLGEQAIEQLKKSRQQDKKQREDLKAAWGLRRRLP